MASARDVSSEASFGAEGRRPQDLAAEHPGPFDVGRVAVLAGHERAAVDLGDRLAGDLPLGRRAWSARRRRWSPRASGPASARRSRATRPVAACATLPSATVERAAIDAQPLGRQVRSAAPSPRRPPGASAGPSSAWSGCRRSPCRRGPCPCRPCTRWTDSTGSYSSSATAMGQRGAGVLADLGLAGQAVTVPSSAMCSQAPICAGSLPAPARARRPRPTPGAWASRLAGRARAARRRGRGGSRGGRGRSRDDRSDDRQLVPLGLELEFQVLSSRDRVAHRAPPFLMAAAWRIAATMRG